MKRFLLLLTLGLAVVAPAWAGGNDSPLPNVPNLPATQQPKWSLKVLQPHLAGGGGVGEEHHTEFIIRAVNAKGQPLVGVPVELPTLWDEQGKPESVFIDSPVVTKSRIEWPGDGKTALTDSKGEARGRFTTGGYSNTAPLVLRGPGDSKTNFEQMWNELPQGERFHNRYGDGDGAIETVNYTLKLKRGDKFIPITGHNMQQKLDYVSLTTYRPTGKLDEDGLPETEQYDWKIKRPKDDAPPEEKARWQFVSKWFQISDLKEVEPGVYQGTRQVYQFDGDDERPQWNGTEIFGIGDYNISVADYSVYLNNPKPDPDDDNNE